MQMPCIYSHASLPTKRIYTRIAYIYAQCTHFLTQLAHSLTSSLSQMATTRDPSGSSGWAATPSGAEDAVSEDENEHHPLELAPPHINLKTDSDFRLLSPKQRLRWTPEMHEKFIKAIAELGGRYSNFTILPFFTEFYLF